MGLIWGIYTLLLPTVLTRKVPPRAPVPFPVGSTVEAAASVEAPMATVVEGLGTADVEMTVAVPVDNTFQAPRAL